MPTHKMLCRVEDGGHSFGGVIVADQRKAVEMSKHCRDPEGKTSITLVRENFGLAGRNSAEYYAMLFKLSFAVERWGLQQFTFDQLHIHNYITRFSGRINSTIH